MEHFDSLLNHDDPTVANGPLDNLVLPVQEQYDVNCFPPSAAEIERVIRRLKNNKASGEDGLPAEVFKTCLPDISEWLQRIFANAWSSEETPQDWSEAILLPFFKKGDRSLCHNYRGISLIDLAGKIFAIILLNRFIQIRDSRTRPNQAGFRVGRGCVDQIFSLRLLLEHRYRYQQPTVTCFLDFAAAFDSVHRSSLWRILAADGVPSKLISLIKSFYLRTGNRVLVNGELSDRFETRTGVRQGCPLSPILFNFVIDWILKTSLEGFPGVAVSPHDTITDLDYADDIALFATSYTELQHVLSRIDTVSKSVGLKINAEKSKIFSSCIPDVEKIPVKVGDQSLEEVISFKYLGSTIRPNGQCVDEITARIDAARKAFFQLKKSLWSRREISLFTKIRVYKATVRTILMYSCETWPLRAEDERRLMVFDHWCLRIILRVRYTDRVSNEYVRRRCFNLPPITHNIRECRLRWAGHVLRKPDDEIVSVVIRGEPDANWRRKRGGQLKSWKDKFKEDLETVTGPAVFGLRRWNRDWLTIAKDLAGNRTQWRATTRDILEAS
jgi:hypothetical protein